MSFEFFSPVNNHFNHKNCRFKLTKIIIFLLLIYIIHADNSNADIAFQTSSIKLPITLRNHISVTYNNSLHIIGGYTEYDQPSNHVYVTKTFSRNDLFNINPNNTTMFTQYSIPSNIQPISCNYQCYTVIDFKVYIYQYVTSNDYLITYNMNNHSFTTTSIMEDLRKTLEIECVLKNATNILMLGHHRIQRPTRRQRRNRAMGLFQLFIYNTETDKWKNRLLYLHEDRIKMACAISNDANGTLHMYIFGGQKDDGTIKNYVEKCSVQTGQCNMIDAMMHRRSQSLIQEFQVEQYNLFQRQSKMLRYFVIYSGKSLKSQQRLEIFDIANEKILSRYPYDHDIELLPVSDFSSLIIDDGVMVITGGKSVYNQTKISSKIKYVNLAYIFGATVHKMSKKCITTYHKHEIRNIDQYLLAENQLIFELYGEYGKIRVTSTTHESNKYLYVTMNTTNNVIIKLDCEYSEAWCYQMNTNLETVSQLTGINMKQNQTVYWMSWNYEHWAMGFGDVIGDLNLYRGKNTQLTNLLGVESVTVHNSDFKFYSDSCSLKLSIHLSSGDNTFDIGDRIFINAQLNDATSLNDIIFIKSNDIIGINHAMHIVENKTCLLCIDNVKDECIECNQGIEIRELSTYHIDKNSYHIYVETTFPNLIMSNPNPMVIIRNIMEVEVIIDVNISNDNISGIYPHSEIFIKPIIHRQTKTNNSTSQYTVSARGARNENVDKVISTPQPTDQYTSQPTYQTTDGYKPCDCYETIIVDNTKDLITPWEPGYVLGEDRYKYCYTYMFSYDPATCTGPLESIHVLLGVCRDPSFDLNSLIASYTGCESFSEYYDDTLKLFGLKCQISTSPDSSSEMISICLTTQPFKQHSYYEYVGYYLDDGYKFKCGQTKDGYPLDNDGLPDLCTGFTPSPTSIPTQSTPIPTRSPTSIPTLSTTLIPTRSTPIPTRSPTSIPTLSTTLIPTRSTPIPTRSPTSIPTRSTSTPTPSPTDEYTSVFKIMENAECGKQIKNLGTAFISPNDCMAAALIDTECFGYEIMWSDPYYYAWGCRCCEPDTGYGKYHSYWDVYSSISTSPTRSSTSPTRLPTLEPTVTLPSQPNGTIIILFDNDLSFQTDAEIFIDFYSDQCLITYNNITINCYNESIRIPSTMKFKSIHENGYSLQIKSNDTKLISQTSYTLKRRIQTVQAEFSKILYLGQMIEIDIEVMDDHFYQQSSSIRVENDQYAIASVINLKYCNESNTFNDSCGTLCEVTTPITKSTELCDSGIQFQTSDLLTIDSTIHLHLSSADTYLEEKDIIIYIEQCPVGQGLVGSESTSFVCEDCPVDEVGIKQNSQCISCDGLPGVMCIGADNLIISYNHWVQVDEKFGEKNISIASTFCPAGFCCQKNDGCNYLHSSKQQQLCAANRDPTVPLCGGCLPNYSEVFRSSG
eukprot:108374_1